MATEKAVIDRIENGNLAVLLVGEEEKRLVVPRASLPQGAKEGDWLKAEIEGGKLLRVEVDPEETRKRRERLARKLEQLRRKS